MTASSDVAVLAAPPSGEGSAASGPAAGEGKLVAAKRRKVAPVRSGHVLPAETAAQQARAAAALEQAKREGPRTIGRLRTYRLVQIVFGLPIRLLFRVRRAGIERLPRRGPLLLVSNHVSWYDPIVLVMSLRRPVSFLAKSKVFESRFRHWFFHTLGGQIKVDRMAHGNEAAVVAAVRAIKQGKAIGVYPEGARTRTGHLCRGRTGIARIALATGVPVWPVVTRGMFEVAPRGAVFPKFWKGVDVVVGPPLTFPGLEGKQADPEVVRDVTDQIMMEMARLLGPEEEARCRRVIDSEEPPLLAFD